MVGATRRSSWLDLEVNSHCKTALALVSYQVIDVEAQVVQRVWEMYTVTGLSIGKVACRLR